MIDGWMTKKILHTHTHMHTHNGILFSHKINQMLLFATTWMNFEGIMLSEINTENRLVVARGEGWEVHEMGEGGQKVQTSSYKTNKFRRCNVQHGEYS